MVGAGALSRGEGRTRGDIWRWEMVMMVAADAMIDVWIRWVMCGLEAMGGDDGKIGCNK